MTAVRTPANSRDVLDGIVITDQDGDVLEVERFASDGDRFDVLLSVRGDAIGLTLEDGLALLSFLADALGVERYLPDEPAPADPVVPERRAPSVILCGNLDGRRCTCGAPADTPNGMHHDYCPVNPASRTGGGS